MAVDHTEIMIMVEDGTMISIVVRPTVPLAADAGLTVMTFDTIHQEDFSLVFHGFTNLLITFALRKNALLH